MSTLQKILFAAAFLAVAGTGLYELREAARWQRENQLLQREQALLNQQLHQVQQERDEALKRVQAQPPKLAMRLPAPMVKLSAPRPDTPAHAQITNLFAGFQGLQDRAPNRLSAEQVDSYLKTHGRDASSLLASYRATGDPVLLREAMEKNPKDPQVALAAILQKDAPPEARRQWLDTFKESDPANALPFYLSGLNYLQSGHIDQAIEELTAASNRSQFRDYSAAQSRAEEDLYLASGYSLAEARAMAPLRQAMDFAGRDEEAVAGVFTSFQSELSSLQQIKALAVNLGDLAKSYKQAGDPDSAQAALQIAADLGQRYSRSSSADGFSQLVGMASEVLALSGLDPNSACGDGQSIQERIQQLRQRRTAIRQLYQDAVPLLGSLNDQDWANYSERVRFFGEPAALQWVIGKYSPR